MYMYMYMYNVYQNNDAVIAIPIVLEILNWPNKEDSYGNFSEVN